MPGLTLCVLNFCVKHCSVLDAVAQLCNPDIMEGYGGRARRVLRGWMTSRHTMRIDGDGPATTSAMSWTFRHGLCQYVSCAVCKCPQPSLDPVAAATTLHLQFAPTFHT